MDHAASIATAAWFNAENLQHVLACLDAGGDKTRIVGGAVRNHLLAEPVKDIDLATQFSPDDVIERASAAGLGAVPTGYSHGTVTVIVNQHPFEVTSLRRDIETDGRRAQVAFGTSWEADACRRDFTINALYANAAGDVIDYVGGLTDIARRHVRFIGDPYHRIREDYLRILRFFRFTAEYGNGPPDALGLTACHALHAGLRILPGERVGRETLLTLRSPSLDHIIEPWLDGGIFSTITGGVSYISRLRRLLEIERNFSDAITIQPLMRLAVLACAITEDIDRLTRRLRLANAERHVLESTLIRRPDIDISAHEAHAKQALLTLGEPVFRDAVLAGWCRDPSPNHRAWYQRYQLPRTWKMPRDPFTGKQLKEMGVAPGPHYRKILQQAREDWGATGYSDDAQEQMRILRAAISLLDQ